jgi:dihydroorotase
MGLMAQDGAVGFTDDGSPVADGDVMRRAMTYARMLGMPIVSHAEDPSLSAGGVMHAGEVSTRLGLAGIPAESEAVAVARDVALAAMTGARLHVQHVSTAAAVQIIRRAKAEGVRVTAEATPHHLTLTDEALLERDAAGLLLFDTDCKMNPPLRTADDVAALRDALRDGTIDCIASDHAPHPLEAKTATFNEAPFGVIGLETTLPVVVTDLIGPGVIDWPRAVAAMTIGPAQALGLQKGTLAVGADADVTVIDPDREWVIDAGAFASRSRNTPFDGKAVKGMAVCVIVGGIVQRDLTA